MSSFKDKCKEYFGTSDIYEVLGIDNTASSKQIKKAYHRLSLLVHPDRVEESQKVIATEKFKVLGKIHSILQDKEKRKCYDDCGEFDEDNEFNWMEYWRAMFKKVEIADIQRYEKEYIGSETELRDIKKAYESSKGNMDVMLEMICFSNCEHEARYIEIVRKMVDNGEVEEYRRFFKEPKHKKDKRRRKWEKEQKLAEKIDMDALQKELEANQEKRMRDFNDLINDIEAKYSKNKKKRKSITSGKESPKKKTKRLKK